MASADDQWAGDDVKQTVRVERMWRCEGNGELYVGPRCGFGAQHVEVTVTTTTTVKESDA